MWHNGIVEQFSVQSFLPQKSRLEDQFRYQTFNREKNTYSELLKNQLDTGEEYISDGNNNGETDIDLEETYIKMMKR